MIDIDKEIEKSAALSRGVAKSFAAATGKRRDGIDVLRTLVWYADIESRLDCCTAYHVERKLEPGAFGRCKDHPEDSYHRNKWRRYRVGADTPRAALIEAVDRQLPGTALLINHPLWAALRGRKSARQLYQEELGRLAPAIQQVIVRDNLYSVGVHGPFMPVDGRCLDKLERRAGLDALACLTILYRGALENDRELAFKIARSLFRVLLITCVSIPFRQWSGYLFEFYRQGIFPLANSDKHHFDFDGFDFVAMVNRLGRLLLRLEDECRIGVSPKDSVTAMWKLTSGGYGLKAWASFEPPIRWEDGWSFWDWVTRP